MGLFDRLRGLFGESGAGDRGTAQQRHGSHWDTVFVADDREAALREVLLHTVESGTPVEAGSQEGDPVVGYREDAGSVGTTVVTVGEEFTTGYPVAEGVTQEMSVTGHTPWATGVEAWVDGTIGDPAVTCFDTGFFAHRTDPPTGTQRCALSVLCYSLDPGDGTGPSVADDGVEVNPGVSAGFLPFEEGGPDDYALWTTVSEVARWQWRDTAGYRLEAPLFRADGRADVDTAMYVADHNLAAGFEPSPGDEVEGLGWVQARFE